MLFGQIQTGLFQKSSEQTKYCQASRYKPQPDFQGAGKKIPPNTQSREELRHLGIKWHLAVLKNSTRNSTATALLIHGHPHVPPSFQEQETPPLPGWSITRIIRCRKWEHCLSRNQIPVDFSGNYHSNPHRISSLQKRFNSTKLECLNPTDLSWSWEQIQGESAELLSLVWLLVQPSQSHLSWPLPCNQADN